MAKVEALVDWRSSEVYNDLERAVLDYAEAMTLTDRDVTDDIALKLQEHFDEKQIVELTAGIAMENYRSKFNNALRVESQGFCVLPKPPD